MNRRKCMTVVIGASTAVLAGCIDAEPDAVITYQIEEGDSGQDSIPSDLADEAGDSVLVRGDQHRWVVVTIEVNDGEMNEDEILDHAYIETNETGHFTRSVVRDGDTLRALYQITVEEDVTGWNIDQSAREIEVTEG